MAFSLNKKASAPKTQSSLWKVEHIIGNEFVTLVLDKPLRVDFNQTEKDILMYLEKMLQKAGINSYVITSALRDYPSDKDLKKLTLFYTEHDSDWYNEIIKPARAKGMIADVVIPFGAALYQVTKTGTDFTVEDLIYPAFENYVYIGHGWIGDYDCFLFPQYSVMDIFCPCLQNPKATPKVELGGWKMNFMITIFKKIAAHKYQLPDDMTTPDLKEVGSAYEKNKEEAIKEVEDFLKAHFNSEICAFDLETSGFDPWRCKIRCITMAFDSKTGYYLEWSIFAENPHLIELLSEMMLSCKHRVTVNGKFDIKFLWVNGLDRQVTVTEDAMTLCHCLCSGRKKGLKTQAFFWTPHGGYDHKLDLYRDSLKKQGIKDPSYYDIPKDLLFVYATMDAVITVRVWLAGLKRMHQFDHDYPTEKPIEHTGGHAYSCYEWYQFVMKIYPIICAMEYDGLLVDEHVIEVHRKVFRNFITKTRKQLAEIFKNVQINGKPVDENFEFSSTTQLGKLLEKAGWDCYGRSATGGYDTSGQAFVEWRRDKVKGVDELTNFRKAGVCLNTYLGNYEKKVNQKTGVVSGSWSGWPQHIVHHEDGTARIHCDFGVCATETFRMISSEPNLQNVPTHSDFGSVTKMSFTTPPAPLVTVIAKDHPNLKDFEITQLGVINTARGYVAALALTKDDKIVDIGEETVLEYDEWSKREDLVPIGLETMWKIAKPTGERFEHFEGPCISVDIDYYNAKAGRLCYLLMTQDAASLEARVATSDTALNEDGIDPILFNVYDPKAGFGEDLHSMTGWNTFCKAVDLPINEITDDDGKTWLVVDIQKIWVERDDKKQLITGAELRETDKILGYEEDLTAD